MSSADLPSSAGSLSNPPGTILPVKEESPAEAGILSDMPVFSAPRDSAQSTPASTFTNSSQPLKQEGDEPPSTAAATAASLTDFSEAVPPQHSWSTTDPDHSFVNAVARGYRTYVIVNDDHEEGLGARPEVGPEVGPGVGPDARPTQELFDERAYGPAPEHYPARDINAHREAYEGPYGGPYLQKTYEPRYEERYAERYDTQYEEPSERYEERLRQVYEHGYGHVHEHGYEHGHEHGHEYMRQDTHGRSSEGAFQQNPAHVPEPAYGAAYEASYHAVYSRVDEHLYEHPRQHPYEHPHEHHHEHRHEHSYENSYQHRHEDHQEQVPRLSDYRNTRRPRRIPPLEAVERLKAAANGLPPVPFSVRPGADALLARALNHRASVFQDDAMQMDVPDPADIVRGPRTAPFSSPLTRKSTANGHNGASAESSTDSLTRSTVHNISPRAEAANDDAIATRRPIGTAIPPEPAVQPVKLMSQPTLGPLRRGKMPEMRPARRPLLGKSTKHTAKPAVKPIADPVDEAATEPVANAAAKTATEPVAQAATEPVAQAATEPVAQAATEHVAEATAEPVAKVAAEPNVKAVAEPVAKPTSEPAVRPVVKLAEPIAKPATKPTKPTSPSATKTAAKSLSKPNPRRASAPFERRATRLSGIDAESLTLPTSLGRRRRRVSEKDALSRVPRELRRLQDTKEFAHVDDKPVVYTVWSNGRYVPANASGEPLPDKSKTIKAASSSNGQKDGRVGDPAEPAQCDEEASLEIPKPVQKRVKKWLSKGLYAGQPMPANHAAGLTASEKKVLAKLPELSKPYPPNKTLPMPIYNGLRMLIQGRDFKMPYDVFHPLPPGQPKPVKYGKMSKNRFVGDAHAIWKKSPNYDDFQSKCICKPETGCDEDCQNRIMLYECNDSICNVGSDRCSNREFQRLAERTASKNPYHIGVEVFKTPNRGHGIRASRSFRPGQIIMEYIGEIITEEESDRRMNELYKDNECYYLMSFDQSLIIDGTSGSFARFVNHSCSPNCRMIKWIVSGQPRIALFAGDRPIMSGEELTYDYNFDPYSSKNVQRCLCGSENCRGVLGPRKSEKMTKAAAAEKVAAEKAAAEKVAAEKAKAEARKASNASTATGKLGKRKRDAESLAVDGNTAKKMRTTAASPRRPGRPALNTAAKKVTTTKAALEALAATAAKQARVTKAAKVKKAKRAAKAAEAAKAEMTKNAKTTKPRPAANRGKVAAAATKAATVFKTSKKTKVVFTKKNTTTVTSKATKGTKGTAATKGAKATPATKTPRTVAPKKAARGPRAKTTSTDAGKLPATKAKATVLGNKVSKVTKPARKKPGPKPKVRAVDVARTLTPVLEPIVNNARSPASQATPMAKAVAARAAQRATEAAKAAGENAASVARKAKNRATAATMANKLPQKGLKRVGRPPAKPAVVAQAASFDLTVVPAKRGRGRPRLSPEDLAKRAAKAEKLKARLATARAAAIMRKARSTRTQMTASTTNAADMEDTPMVDVYAEEQQLATEVHDKVTAFTTAKTTTKAKTVKFVSAGSKSKPATLPLPSSSPATEAPRRKRGRPPKKVAAQVAPVVIGA